MLKKIVHYILKLTRLYKWATEFGKKGVNRDINSKSAMIKITCRCAFSQSWTFFMNCQWYCLFQLNNCECDLCKPQKSPVMTFKAEMRFRYRYLLIEFRVGTVIFVWKFRLLRPQNLSDFMVNCVAFSFNFIYGVGMLLSLFKHFIQFFAFRSSMNSSKMILDCSNDDFFHQICFGLWECIYLFWCARLHANLSLPLFCFHIFLSLTQCATNHSLFLPFFASSSSSRAKKHTHNLWGVLLLLALSFDDHYHRRSKPSTAQQPTYVSVCASKYHLNRGYQVSSLHTYIKYTFPHYTIIIITIITIIVIMIISISNCAFFSAYFFSTLSVFMRRCVSNKSDWFIYEQEKKQLEKVVITSKNSSSIGDEINEKLNIGKATPEPFSI